MRSGSPVFSLRSSDSRSWHIATGNRLRRTDDGRPKTGDPSPSGFTLFEVIITLVILSVMAAISIPAFLREPVRTDMDEAQGRLETLFRMARDSAVMSAAPVTVVLDSASGLVWIDSPGRDYAQQAQTDPSGLGVNNGIRLRSSGNFGGGSTLGGRTGVAPAPGTVAGQPLGLRPSVRMELFQSRVLFTFSPDGTVSGDSILLRGPRNEMRLIRLDPWTADVQAL